MKEKTNEKVSKIEWGIAIALFSIAFFLFLFDDILITTNASITFDDLLLKGKIYHLYEALYQTFGGSLEGAFITYDFPIYIFFGIWNIPLLIITKLTGIYWIEYYALRIYAKLFLIALMIIFFLVFKKIMDYFKLNKNDYKMYQYLFFSSSLTIMVLGMFAGYDLLPLIFIVLGLYYYLKEDKRKFLLFFTIATSIKLFALFIFLPLLLLKEKNIWKIILYSIISLSLVILPKLIFHNAPMYYESMHAFEDLMMSKLSASYLITPFGNTSIFITLFILICCWCYGTKIEEKKKLDLYTMYIPFLIYGSFICFCSVHPQWTMLLIPFFLFFVIYNKSKRQWNILLECAFSVSFLLLLYLTYRSVFNPNLMSGLFGLLIPQTNGIIEMEIMIKYGKYSSLLSAVVLGVFLYFAWLNHPKKLLGEEKKEKWDHSILIMRSLIIAPFIALIIYYYFK